MDPAKDADGLHPMSLGRLVLNEPGPLPCTPNGIVTLLRRHGVEINGRPRRRRRPRRHHRPPDAAAADPAKRRTRRSRSATPARVTCGATSGRPTSSSPRPASAHLVKPEDVKPGAAVLDVGVSRDENGKIVGDVHPGVAEVAAWISPNPGGVGPMTRAQLLVNVVEAAERAAAEASAVSAG